MMSFGQGAWLELQNPLWILLLIPIVLGLFWRLRVYMVKKAHAHLAPLFAKGALRIRRIARSINYGVAPACRFTAPVLLALVLADITRAYVFTADKQTAHRILVLVDSSSSMYGFIQSGFKSITCKTNGDFFPRIRGACQALYQLLEELKKSSIAKGPAAKDLVAVGQFATQSYVVSYPTDDYSRLRERIDRLEFYSDAILGIGTNMHLAIWDMYLMALDRNRDRRSGRTYLSDDELRKIGLSLAPGPRDSALVFPLKLQKKLEKIREELRDTTFIVITDALMRYLVYRVEWEGPQSIRRQMQFGEYLQTPWYFLSTDEFYPELARIARLTGYGPAGGKNRGNFLMVKRESDFAHMRELMSHILQSRLGTAVPVKVERRESWAGPFAFAILILLSISVLWNKLFSRSLTTSE